MATETLIPQSIVSLNNFTPNNLAYIQDDPYNRDSNNLVPSRTPLHSQDRPLLDLKFPKPNGTLTGTQTINVYFTDPNWVGLVIRVKENGSVLWEKTSYEGYGNVAVYQWDASILSDKSGANVTIEVVGVVYNLMTIQSLSAVRWEANTTGVVIPPPPSIWDELTPIPAPRSRATGQWFKGKFYLFGGWDTVRNSLATTYIYNPVQNSWSTGRPYPNGGLRDAGSVVIGNAIYVVGGHDGSYSDRVLKYYPDTDSWDSTQTILPFTTAMSVVTTDGTWVYILSGFQNGVYSNDCWRFNPSNNIIESLAPKPTASAYAGHVYYWEDVYMAGGFTSTTYAQTQMEIYNVRNDTWRTGSPFPTYRWGHRMAVVDGNIYSFGGVLYDGMLGRDVPTDDIYEFDLQNGTYLWYLKEEKMPYKTHHHLVEIYNRNVYLLSGQLDGGVDATNQFYVWDTEDKFIVIPIVGSTTIQSASSLNIGKTMRTTGNISIQSTVNAGILRERAITGTAKSVARVDMVVSIDRQVTPEPIRSESDMDAVLQRRTEIHLRSETESNVTAGISEVDAIYSRVNIVSTATMDILVQGTIFLEPNPSGTESTATADIGVHRTIGGRSETDSESEIWVGIERGFNLFSKTESWMNGIATVNKGITATSASVSTVELYGLPLIKHTGRLNVIVRSDVTAWAGIEFKVSGNVYVNSDVSLETQTAKETFGESVTESVVNDLFIPMVKEIESTVHVVTYARADTVTEGQIMVTGTAHGITTATAETYVHRLTDGRSESFGGVETNVGVDRGTFVRVDIITETDMVMEKDVVLQPEIIVTDSEVRMTAIKTISVMGESFIHSSTEMTAERHVSISSTIQNESDVYLENMEKIGWTFGTVNVESTARMNVETLGEVFVRLTSRNESDISLETVKVDRILDGISDTDSEVHMTPYKTISVNMESFIEPNVETSLSRGISISSMVSNHSEVQPLPVTKIGWTFGQIDMESSVDLDEGVQVERIIQGTSDNYSDMSLESIERDIPIDGFSDVFSDVRGNVSRNIPIDGHISVESSSVLYVLVFGSSEVGMVVTVTSSASSELTVLRETFMEVDIISDAITQTRVDRWINGIADIESDMSLVLGNLVPFELEPIHAFSTVYMQEPIDTYLEAENALYEGVSADDDGKLLSYTIDSGVGRHIEFIFEFKINPVGLQQLEFQVQGTAGQPFRLEPFNTITREWDSGTMTRYDGIIDQQVASLIIPNAEPFLDTENKIRIRMISTYAFTSGELTLSTDYAELLKTYLVTV